MSLPGARQKVLSIYKALHRTRKTIFKEDENALKVAREKINENFRKNVDVKDPEKIEMLLGTAREAEEALRTMVIQAKLDQKTGRYVTRTTKDTHFVENILFDPNADIPKGGRRRKPKSDEKPS